MDAPTAAIAGYAAVVSTGSLGWQIYTFRQQHRDRVTVNPSFALVGMTDGSTLEVVAIGVTNRSAHPIRVTGVGVDAQDGSDRQVHQLQEFPGAELPGTVAPNDSGSTYMVLGELEASGFDIYRPVTAWAQLSTGAQVSSKAKTLRVR